MLIKLYNKFHHLFLYGIIGVFSSGLDFLIYSFLTEVVDLYYLFSNVISVCAGILTSFTLNRLYNFKVKDKAKRRFLIFFSVGLLGLFFSSLILYFCIQFMHLNEMLSKLLSIVLVVFVQFLLNKKITFKKS